MSEINLDLTVNDTNLDVTVNNTDLTFVPENIELNMYLGGIGVPGGSVGQVQFNAGEVLAGTANLTYSNGVTSVTNIDVTNTANLGDVGNITITGGNTNAILTTDGTGVLFWGNSAAEALHANVADIANYASYAGNVINSSQPNITTVGTLVDLVATGNVNFSGANIVNFSGANTVSLGTFSNVKITGGTNGYVLQTDGTGNLSWTAQTGGSGNGVPGGSNTQIQFNDAGTFGGLAGFTVDKITGNVNMPANLIVAGTVSGSINANYANFAGNVVNASQANITSLGNLTSLTVQGLTSIQEATEKVTSNSVAATGTVNFDILTQAILFNTSNASSNFTLNIRGNSTTTLNSVMSSNQSMTCTFININGANAYYANVIKIDGTTITPLYLSGSAPAQGTINGRDVYTFNIIKTAANTYTAFATIGSYY